MTDMEAELAGGSLLVTPGEIITNESIYMRGHGTFVQNNSITASVAGTVERVNRLITVVCTRARYTGEVGDVVVGRVTELGSKRWRVDIDARQDATLQLSAIHLPGGIQRRKSESDELQMRSFFAESDMVVAQVQSFFSDGGIALHTRSLKYGKLRNGLLCKVQHTLIQRSSQHFHTLPWGVQVILGRNGYVWVSTPAKEHSAEALYASTNDPISPPERQALARVANCLHILDQHGLTIGEPALVFIYKASLGHAVPQLHQPDVMAALAAQVQAHLPSLG